MDSVKEKIRVALRSWSIGEPTILTSAIDFAATSATTAEQLLIITAALNTIFYKRPDDAQMASEVLEIAAQEEKKTAGKDAFQLPSSIKDRLQNLADKVKVTKSGATSAEMMNEKTEETPKASAASSSSPYKAEPAKQKSHVKAEKEDSDDERLAFQRNPMASSRQVRAKKGKR